MAVFVPLFHAPVSNTQLPAAVVQRCVSPTMSFMSIQAFPTVLVFQA